MAKYKLTKDGVQDTETTAFIPDDMKNKDWRNYQYWLDGLGPEGPDGEPGKSLGTGPNTPDPQFTTEEIEAQKQFEKTRAENAVIEARGKLDAASAESVDTKRFEDELTKAKAALAVLPAKPLAGEI